MKRSSPHEETVGRLTAGHAAFLHYDQALANGWPVAIGVIEGARRHLISDWFDITGARWGLTGAEAVLELRGLIATGDFEAYWRYRLMREHHCVHHAHDQNEYNLTA